jgi:hypothetical protein
MCKSTMSSKLGNGSWASSSFSIIDVPQVASGTRSAATNRLDHEVSDRGDRTQPSLVVGAESWRVLAVSPAAFLVFFPLP